MQELTVEGLKQDVTKEFDKFLLALKEGEYNCGADQQNANGWAQIDVIQQVVQWWLDDKHVAIRDFNQKKRADDDKTAKQMGQAWMPQPYPKVASVRGPATKAYSGGRQIVNIEFVDNHAKASFNYHVPLCPRPPALPPVAPLVPAPHGWVLKPDGSWDHRAGDKDKKVWGKLVYPRGF